MKVRPTKTLLIGTRHYTPDDSIEVPEIVAKRLLKSGAVVKDPPSPEETATLKQDLETREKRKVKR